MGPVWSITEPYYFKPITVVVSEDFFEPGFRGGAEFSSLPGVLGMVAIPFFNFWFWWLLVDVTTRL